MIRIFKLVLLLVVSQVAFGQAPSNYTNINGRYRWIAGMFDSTFHIPKGTSPSLRTGGSTNAGGLFYNTSDSSVYTYTGTQWIKARGSINPSDTTNKYVTQVYKKNGSDSVFYVKGGNHLFAFVDSVGSPGGGGGGKIYYFNGGVSMGTIGGLQMYELGDTANTGAAANFTRSTTGNIANFITDSNKPGLVQIPAGVWSVDAWLSETGGGANHAEIWVEVEKWDGSTITTIATSPIEQITEGSTPNLYSWSVSIPTTSLTVTDRIIIQFYISNTNGKTVTLYTQNGYVGEVHTTFTTGIGAINGLTAPAQYLVTGTSGTDFNINSVTATHTFNLPTASATNRGALSTTDWTTFNSKLSPADTVSLSNRINLKLNISDTAAMLSPYARTNAVNAGLALKVNISDTSSMLSPYARKNFLNAGTGISYSSTTGTIANTAPDQTVALNAGTGISISGTYPNFTITNSSPSSGGTVTSVGSNNGTGLTGGPITTSGTLAIDTLLVSTRAWRQKGIDSLQANLTAGLATKLNISDTASMLSPYARTNVVNAGLALKVNISDTASMLTPYLRKIDTTSMLSPYLRSNVAAATYVAQTRTITINGTTQDLTADRTWNVGTVTTAAATGGGQVAFFNGSTVLTSISTLYFDGVNKLAIGNSSPDSMLSVTQGAHIQRGVRLSGLPTAPGTRALRVDANGTLSVSDTLTNGISGSGTTNYIPKFTSSSAIGNSLLREGTNSIGLGYTPSTWSYTGFQINGAALHGSPTETDAGLSANAYYNSGWKYYANNYASQYRQVNGEHEFNVAGIGTAGNSVSFSTAIKILTSGNVGIGTSSPDGKLDIAQAMTNGSTSAFTTPHLALTATSTTDNTGFVGMTFATSDNANYGYSYGALRSSGGLGDLIWRQHYNSAQGTELMRLSYSGNLGLGVTPSAWTLKAFQIPSGSITGGNAGQGLGLVRNGYFDGSWKYVASSTASSYEQDAGQHRWFTAPSGTAGNAISFTQAMTLDASGNLGVGTTVPGVRLHAEATNSNVAIINVIGTAPNYIFDVRDDGVSKFRVDPSGNVGIGITIPTSLLHVNSGTTATQTVANFAAANYGSSSSRTYIQIGTQYGDGSSRIGSINTTGNQSALVFQTQSATSGVWNDAMYINGSGNVGIGTTSPSGNGVGGSPTILQVNNSSTSVALISLSNQDNSNGAVPGVLNFVSGGLSGADKRISEIYAIKGDTSTSTPNGSLVFATANSSYVSERMRITSGGNVGINTQTPNATFHVNGSIASAISIKTATYTLTSSDYTVVFDLNGNATANLPNATTCSGRIYVIKINRTNVSDVLTIDPNGAQTIDGNATYDLQCQQAITIQSDGSNWRIIGDFLGGLNCL